MGDEREEGEEKVLEGGGWEVKSSARCLAGRTLTHFVPGEARTEGIERGGAD